MNESITDGMVPRGAKFISVFSAIEGIQLMIVEMIGSGYGYDGKINFRFVNHIVTGCPANPIQVDPIQSNQMSRVSSCKSRSSIINLITWMIKDCGLLNVLAAPISFPARLPRP